MMIPVEKYHGLGNDFILVHADAVPSKDRSEFARFVCNRHTGIGADGCIFVATNPLTMIYYNTDGSQAKMCGNGIRTVAHFAYNNNLITSTSLTINTLAGPHQIECNNEDTMMVSVNMGQPQFDTDVIPMKVSTSTYINQPYRHNDNEYRVTSLLMGATHTVVEVKELSESLTVSLGQSIQSLPQYPDSTNVNVFEWVDYNTIQLLTYERGVGLTKACGTGATAVYASLVHQHSYTGTLTCLLPLGTLELSQNEDGDIIMTGPSEHIMSGTVRWELCE